MSNALIVSEYYVNVKTDSKITLGIVNMQQLFLTEKISLNE